VSHRKCNHEPERDATELQVTRNGKDALELVVEQVKLETQEEKQCTDKLEQKLKEVFTKIPDNACRQP
jgi:hypothetical protein